jgi:hypothetical protein
MKIDIRDAAGNLLSTRVAMDVVAARFNVTKRMIEKIADSPRRFFLQGVSLSRSEEIPQRAEPWRHA